MMLTCHLFIRARPNRPKDGKLISKRDTSKQESGHLQARKMFQAPRYNIKSHVMRTARFTTRFNFDQGYANLGWEQILHADIPLMLKLNEVYKDRYKTVYRA